MGGTSSKRTLVIEDAPGGTVKISEAVVRRLKGLPDEEPEIPKVKEPSPPPPPPPEPPKQVEQVEAATETLPPPPPPPAAPEPEPKPEPKVEPEPEPPLRPYPQQIDPQLEDLYVAKLKELQEKQAELMKNTNDHFKNAVQEVEGKFIDYTASPVCQDLQSKVLQCYQENSGEPLQCSGIVAAFTNCVDRARMVAHSSRMQIEVR